MALQVDTAGTLTLTDLRVDGQDTRVGVNAFNGELSLSRVEVVGGIEPYGGCINTDSVQLFVDRSYLLACVKTTWGGAIDVYETNAVITNTRLFDNTNTRSGGAAIRLYEGQLALAGC